MTTRADLQYEIDRLERADALTVDLVPSPTVRDLFERFKKHNNVDSAMAEVRGYYGDLNIFEAGAVPSYYRSDNLVKDGCDMIKAAYVFLSLLECPPDARDLILCLMGISRGNSGELLIITDDQIAKHMGHTRNKISEKRQALIAWEQSKDYSIVRIHEREFDTSTGKYKPTMYEVKITQFVAEFVRLARDRFNNPRNAIETAVETGLLETALKVSENIPNAEIVRRKKQQEKIPPSQETQLEMKRARALKTISDCLSMVGEGWSDWLDGFIEDARELQPAEHKRQKTQ